MGAKFTGFQLDPPVSKMIDLLEQLDGADSRSQVISRLVIADFFAKFGEDADPMTATVTIQRRPVVAGEGE
jgi:hypothetical protein